MFPAGNKAKHLLSVNHSAKTIQFIIIHLRNRAKLLFRVYFKWYYFLFVLPQHLYHVILKETGPRLELLSIYLFKVYLSIYLFTYLTLYTRLKK